MRKHHVEGMAAQAAAEALASAARTPGSSALMVDGLVAVSVGEATEAELADFAAWAVGPEADRLIEEAAARPPPAKDVRAA